MSKHWIDSFQGGGFTSRRGAYCRWCDAIPKQLNGFKFVYPMLEWPMYPFRYIKPGEFFAVPTPITRSVRTSIWRAQKATGGVFFAKLLEDGKSCAVFRYK